MLVRIKSYERGLRFRDGEFVEFIRGPAQVRLWSRFWGSKRDRIEVVSTLETQFKNKLLDLLLQDRQVRNALEVVDLGDTERALVWKDERLAYFLGPGRYAFWKGLYDVRIEKRDVSELRFRSEQLDAVLAFAGTAEWLRVIDVDAAEEVLLYRDGELVESLRSGRYVYWNGNGRLTQRAFDLREQLLTVDGQEIMTRDKVTLRVNVIVNYRVIDARRVAEAVENYVQSLYRAAQLIVRAAIGTRTLDELLSNKDQVATELRDELVRLAAMIGLEVRSVGLRDVILPGEMKSILNQVITAEKEAQANLIRRREETAAARSQANTARLLSENPTLARMKELEALTDILTGTNATFLFGSGDLLTQVRGLTDRSKGGEA